MQSAIDYTTGKESVPYVYPGVGLKSLMRMVLYSLTTLTSCLYHLHIVGVAFITKHSPGVGGGWGGGGGEGVFCAD